APTGAGGGQAKTGDLDINNLGGNAAAFDLTIQGGGAATTVIDGNKTDRVFQIFANRTVRMSGVTIQNGMAATGDFFVGGSDDAFGGGILNEGTLTLTDCVVQNNVAQGTTVTNSGFASGGSGNGGRVFTARPAP